MRVAGLVMCLALLFPLPSFAQEAAPTEEDHSITLALEVWWGTLNDATWAGVPNGANPEASYGAAGPATDGAVPGRELLEGLRLGYFVPRPALGGSGSGVEVSVVVEQSETGGIGWRSRFVGGQGAVLIGVSDRVRVSFGLEGGRQRFYDFVDESLASNAGACVYADPSYCSSQAQWSAEVVDQQDTLWRPYIGFRPGVDLRVGPEKRLLLGVFWTNRVVIRDAVVDLPIRVCAVGTADCYLQDRTYHFDRVLNGAVGMKVGWQI